LSKRRAAYVKNNETKISLPTEFFYLTFEENQKFSKLVETVSEPVKD
jgi:hypothetical protein